jgi:protein-L-isoaspartate O-methyltransferase
MTNWQHHAVSMAGRFLYPQSRWWDAVTTTPRHLLVPYWFEWNYDTECWELRDGVSSGEKWLDAAYDAWETLVTRVGPVHADHAGPGTTRKGWPTSSSTLPYLVIAMYRHARIYDGADVLDVGTGSGYGCALLARRLGEQHVTSIDIDPYLADAAAGRLSGIGLHPKILVTDATAELPGSYDRIVPMVSMPAIPASWLTALRPGGRLVFCLAGSSIVITAAKTPDGGATGQVEHDSTWFMAARHGTDYPPRPDDMPEAIRSAPGEHVSHGRYPVPLVTSESDLDPMLAVTAPGITHHYDYDPQTDIQTAWMRHADGSWARATGKIGERPVVHQAGPRHLWDILDDIRHRWILDGTLPVRGADVEVDPDGTCHLSKGKWNATIR